MLSKTFEHLTTGTVRHVGGEITTENDVKYELVTVRVPLKGGVALKRGDVAVIMRKIKPREICDDAPEYFGD